MVKRYGHWIFIALVFLVPATVFAVVKWYQNRYTPLPVLGEAGHRIEAFSLQNQTGGFTSSDDMKGKIVVANFFFTHCPVVCPKMVRNLKKVQGVFINDPQLLIVSFTVDPERDSVGQLRQYAARMNITGNWLLLTGRKHELYKLARKSFLATATDGDGGPGDFIHSESLVLVDGIGRLRGFYNGTDAAQADGLIRDIERLKKESPAAD